MKSRLIRYWHEQPLPAQIALAVIGAGIAGAISLFILLGIAMALAFPNLPDVSELSDYRPKLPLRVYSVEGTVIGEFGEEHRRFVSMANTPPALRDAVLATEDARFYQHGGVDWVGMIRAVIANLGRTKSQGASTITMQVARNVFLSTEKTYTRKIYEILLTYKLENLLTKDQILEIYLNQIYLGQRAYGFAAASETYFGKALKDISIAEAAMLAGLPKAPSAYNPIANPKRARARQLYIISRMLDNGFITPEQAAAARTEEIHVRAGATQGSDPNDAHAQYAAEMVRQTIYAQYGDETYTRGLRIYTSIRAEEQQVAYAALRRAIMSYERRQPYRGPEKVVPLPLQTADNAEAIAEAVADAIMDRPNEGDLLTAVVLDVKLTTPRKVTVMNQDGETIEITGSGLRYANDGLQDNAPAAVKLRRGAVVRIRQTNADATAKDAGVAPAWELLQLPEVEGAFVSLDPRDGSIHALVGGFDYDKNKFNHVTQAWRQPGSSFKPFIYSAALEKGFTPATIVNDGPLFFEPDSTGGQPWEPKNYDGVFEGPMPLRRALARSKNMVSIRVLDAIGPRYAQEWSGRFGFDPKRHPAYLTMALGAGTVTPMQMAVAYSVFANGGHLLDPWMIRKITDPYGKVLYENTPKPLDDSTRTIDARNAFVMCTLLNEVARVGTAARTQAELRRPDIYGKTGTTNDSMDAWFAGFQPTLTAITWIGYDTPRSLGDRETGGGLALPIWISYMETALKGVPVQEEQPPEGVTQVGVDWMYAEHAQDGGVQSLGLDENDDGMMAAPGGVMPTLPYNMQSGGSSGGNAEGDEEPQGKASSKSKILDLFRKKE